MWRKARRAVRARAKGEGPLSRGRMLLELAAHAVEGDAAYGKRTVQKATPRSASSRSNVYNGTDSCAANQR